MSGGGFVIEKRVGRFGSFLSHTQAWVARFIARGR
jgi:hypothetical protein